MYAPVHRPWIRVAMHGEDRRNRFEGVVRVVTNGIEVE
jgi:hypothetical protein